MRVSVGDVSLYVDVLSPKLVADGWGFKARPTVVLIHGGPGFDHLAFRQPGLPYERLADTAQVVLVDLRGSGRSDVSTPDQWNLKTWAGDLAALFGILGIERPVLLGESAGGFIALEFAARHPSRIAGLILMNSSACWSLDRVAAAFSRRGGEEAGAAALAFWQNPRVGVGQGAGDWTRLCLPLYVPAEGLRVSASEPPPYAGALEADVPHVRYNHDVLCHFATTEMRTFNHLGTLAAATYPVLLLAGAQDPICPVEDSDDMARVIPPELVTYVRLDHAGHTVAAADPERTLEETGRFLGSLPPGGSIEVA